MSGIPAFLCLSEYNFWLKFAVSSPIQKDELVGQRSPLCLQGRFPAEEGEEWQPRPRVGELGGLVSSAEEWWSHWAPGCRETPPAPCFIWLLCKCMSASSSSYQVSAPVMGSC